MPFAEGVETLPEDVLIHTWNLARATGGDTKVTPPPGADVQTEFLCFVGRQP
jgi:hypothetical protein